MPRFSSLGVLSTYSYLRDGTIDSPHLVADDLAKRAVSMLKGSIPNDIGTEYAFKTASPRAHSTRHYGVGPVVRVDINANLDLAKDEEYQQAVADKVRACALEFFKEKEANA